MVKLLFNLVEKDGPVKDIMFNVKNACLFGFSGRNIEEVRKHVKEMEGLGIRGPKNMPEHFKIPVWAMTQEREITCVGDKTSGEIEFFFLKKKGIIYVGVGSEHTDRSLEAIDIVKSKAICQKPMGDILWKYEDVKTHWDKIQLISWQIVNGKEKIYQDGVLGDLITLEDLEAEANKLYSTLEEGIFWSGTIPTVEGLVFGSHFKGCMKDPVLDRIIEFDYEIKTVKADE